ncbi:MAG: TonB-dependent receptor [Bacteroidales bacterium]|jgi:outer membrane receptor protein involved in Fe transport|nr:TonB-dependent receptor [Bacteroidales bacterium]
MKKLALIFAALALTCSVADAQKNRLTLVGTVADSAFGQPLAFCTVQILSKNDTNKRLDATTTDIDGVFSLKRVSKVASVMKISYVGYKTAVFDIDFSAAVGDTLRLDTVLLVSEATNLGTLNIEAAARRFEMDVDKLTMNIDEGLSGASENAFDLLRKTPGVSIDQDEKLTLNGQSGVKFQFSGKDMKLDWEAIKSMLKSMTPEKIEKIEVISNPSAKYESDGAAGIINIIFDAKKNYGVNGSVGADAGYDAAWNYGGYGNISYMDAKWTISASGRINRNNNHSFGGWSKSKRWRDAADTIMFSSTSPESDSHYDYSYVQLYGDYTIDSNNLIGFQVYYNGGGQPDNFSEDITRISHSTTDYNSIDSSAYNLSKSSYSNKSLSAGLNYIHAFDTNDTKLSSDLDFSFSNSRNSSQADYNYYEGDFANLLRQEGLKTENSDDSYDVSWKADFQKKLFKDGKLEAGFKMAFSYQDNGYDAEKNNGAGYVNDTNRTNSFQYTENIYALYLSYSHKFGKKISLRGGLRGEYTHTEGEQSIHNITIPIDYANLFPNARVSYMVNEKNRFTLGYNYRISRPWYSQLNPFLVKYSEYSESQGNPYLNPSLTNNFSLQYSWNYCLNTTLSYGYTKDAIVDVPELKPSSIATIEKPQNLATAHNVRLYLSFNKNIGEKFFCYLSIGGSYNQSQYVSNNQLVDFNSFGTNGWANLSYQLPWKLSVSMFGYIYWNQGLSINKSSPYQNISLSLNRSFFDKALRLSLSANNLLSVKKRTNSSQTPNTMYESEWKSAGMGFNVRVSYSFGKMYEKKKLTKIDSDDNNDRSGGSQK